MRTLRKKRRARLGFSLIETLVSTFIFMACLAAVFGAIGSGRNFAGTQNALAEIQMDSRRALERISTELRMCAWLDSPFVGEPRCPYVFVNGDAKGSYGTESHAAPAQHVAPGDPAFGDVKGLAFKIPRDLDGDGLLTNALTGEIEWTPNYISYSVITSAGGVNTLVRREAGVVTDRIASYVERVTFDTIYTDPTIGMNDIVVTLYMAKPTNRGVWVDAIMSTVVSMRNVDDAS